MVTAVHEKSPPPRTTYADSVGLPYMATATTAATTIIAPATSTAVRVPSSPNEARAPPCRKDACRRLGREATALTVDPRLLSPLLLPTHGLRGEASSRAAPLLAR